MGFNQKIIIMSKDKNGWIKSIDRLPESLDDVVIYIVSPEESSTYVSTGHYDVMKWHSESIDYDSDMVTHWMPLPKPPKD